MYALAESEEASKKLNSTIHKARRWRLLITSGDIPETRNTETPCDKVIYKMLYNDMSIYNIYIDMVMITRKRENKNMSALEKLRDLPFEIATEAMNDLLDYDKVTIIFENGGYNVSPHTILNKQYAKDRKHIGDFKAVEIYPDEKERTALRRMRDTHTERMAEILLNQKNRPSCNHDLLKVAIELKSYEW